MKFSVKQDEPKVPEGGVVVMMDGRYWNIVRELSTLFPERFYNGHHVIQAAVIRQYEELQGEIEKKRAALPPIKPLDPMSQAQGSTIFTPSQQWGSYPPLGGKQ